MVTIILACASIWIVSFIVVAILVARAPLGVEIPGKGFYYVKDK